MVAAQNEHPGSVQWNNLLIPAPCSFNAGVTDLNIDGHKEFSVPPVPIWSDAFLKPIWRLVCPVLSCRSSLWALVLAESENKSFTYSILGHVICRLHAWTFVSWLPHTAACCLPDCSEPRQKISFTISGSITSTVSRSCSRAILRPLASRIISVRRGVRIQCQSTMRRMLFGMCEIFLRGGAVQYVNRGYPWISQSRNSSPSKWNRNRFTEQQNQLSAIDNWNSVDL
jgi:hypothetical protein